MNTFFLAIQMILVGSVIFGIEPINQWPWYIIASPFLFYFVFGVQYGVSYWAARQAFMDALKDDATEEDKK